MRLSSRSKSARNIFHQGVEEHRLVRYIRLELAVHPAASFRVTHQDPVRELTSVRILEREGQRLAIRERRVWLPRLKLPRLFP